MTDDLGRARQVLSKTLERTQAGRLPWTQSRRTEAYDVYLPSGTLEVATVDDDGVAPYEFIIYSNSESSEAVYRIDSGNSPELEADIRELRELAARQVRGVDETLDGLLGDLDA